MTPFSVSVVFPDGSWIPIAIEAAPQSLPPTNLLHEHHVTFGTKVGEQFTVRLTPGELQSPPIPVDPPVISGNLD